MASLTNGCHAITHAHRARATLIRGGTLQRARAPLLLSHAASERPHMQVGRSLRADNREHVGTLLGTSAPFTGDQAPGVPDFKAGQVGLARALVKGLPCGVCLISTFGLTACHCRQQTPPTKYAHSAPWPLRAPRTCTGATGLLRRGTTRFKSRARTMCSWATCLPDRSSSSAQAHARPRPMSVARAHPSRSSSGRAFAPVGRASAILDSRCSTAAGHRLRKRYAHRPSAGQVAAHCQCLHPAVC
jgi:hypothetical protein